MCALVNEKVINMTLQDSVYNHVFKSKNECLLVYVPELKDMINVVNSGFNTIKSIVHRLRPKIIKNFNY